MSCYEFPILASVFKLEQAGCILIIAAQKNEQVLRNFYTEYSTIKSTYGVYIMKLLVRLCPLITQHSSQNTMTFMIAIQGPCTAVDLCAGQFAKVQIIKGRWLASARYSTVSVVKSMNRWHATSVGSDRRRVDSTLR